jgi:hypothetical protein
MNHDKWYVYHEINVFRYNNGWVKGSYERLEGGVNRSYPNFTSFQIKARQEGKFSRCATK